MTMIVDSCTKMQFIQYGYTWAKEMDVNRPVKNVHFKKVIKCLARIDYTQKYIHYEKLPFICVFGISVLIISRTLLHGA